MAEIDTAAAEAAPLAAELRDLQGLAENFGRAMTTAFRRSAVDGRALEDVLKSLALSLSSRALNQALAPIGQGLFSGLFGSLLWGSRLQGGGFGQASSLAAGGHASSSGSNATRADALRGGVNVVFHVTTPDAESFRRAEGEVAAMVARAVVRGQRGL
jgi:hypothetical protein